MSESQFGGVPADEQPKSQFGGELVSRPSKSIAKRPGDSTFPEKVAGFGYGLGTSLAGAPGEIEEFLTTPAKGPKLLGEGQMFPTTKQVQSKLKDVGIEPPSGTKGSQIAGEVTGALVPAGPGLFRGAGKMVGTTTKEGERIASIAERLGFKLSPSQVREAGPVAERGAVGAAKQNQTLANRLASEGTGKKVDEITAPFIKERLKTLGDEFDAVYKGKEFAIDPSITPTLQNLIAYEQQLGFGGFGAVKSAADSIITNVQNGKIAGDDLQRLRNALTQAARNTDSRGKAHEIYELVDVLDEAVESRNPGLKAKLDVIRPQYRNTVILEDLYNSGGIHQGNISLERLGNQIGDKAALRRNPQDIDNLGMLGSQLGMRAMWEAAGEDMPGLVKGAVRTHGLVPELVRGMSLPLRTSTARKAQRVASRDVSAGRGAAEALGLTLPPYEFGKAVSGKNE